MTKAQCEAKKESLGIKECNYDNDYWAAAVEKCGGVQNIPTQDDLYELAKAIYGANNCANYECHGSIDSSKIPQNINDAFLDRSSDLFIWATGYTSYNGIIGRRFKTSSSVTSDRARSSSYLMGVCVGDL